MPFNHYITNFRRFHNHKVQYLRVIEEHKDGYPHIHVILQFEDARIRVENSKYFDRHLYQKWKHLWTYGHSDYQRPAREGIYTLGYVMKYCLKNQTATTVWKKVLEPESKPTVPYVPNSQSVDSSQIQQDVSVSPVKKYGVKLMTWSRDFSFAPFRVNSQSLKAEGSQLALS